MSYRMSSPRIHVTFFDGTEHDVQTTNAEMNRWEDTAMKHRWPVSPDDPGLPKITWYTFLAWAALRREGVIGAETPFERFRFEVCKDAQAAEDDDSEVDDLDREAGQVLYGDPTRPAPEAGSLSP